MLLKVSAIAVRRLSLGCVLVLSAFPGCEVQHVPQTTHTGLTAICQRHQLRVGILPEPFRPLVFPVVNTGKGARLTGLNVQLIRELAVAMSEQCGGQVVTPLAYPVWHREVYSLLQEDKLDLFLSAVGANVPAPAFAGVAFSTPYFYNGGVTGITKRPDVVHSVRALLRPPREKPVGLFESEHALIDLTVAVQEGTSAHLYALANLKRSKLVLCDSLPAAFESDHPAIDVILGSQPVLEFLTERVRTEWAPLTRPTGEPLLLTREHYAIVMPEQRYELRWFVNKFLFHLDDTGRLAEMRRRWFEEEYSYPARARAEGLPFSNETTIERNDHGLCRLIGRL